MLQLLIYFVLLIANPLEKAPNFEFIHESGELQSLKSYEGNVVYIAFWASWCKPCLVNFQEYNELRKEMQEAGVVLLNVSLDKNHEDWQKALMSYSFLNGENVHVTDIRELMTLYNLTFIPEYRILNKKMEFVTFVESVDYDVMIDFQNLLKE